uniref:Uncharacterized protein n=1 Tax=Anguilla anguilla TaxID=7936 RepID=A0A0E9XW30_ANGAN
MWLARVSSLVGLVTSAVWLERVSSLVGLGTSAVWLEGVRSLVELVTSATWLERVHSLVGLVASAVWPFSIFIVPANDLLGAFCSLVETVVPVEYCGTDDVGDIWFLRDLSKLANLPKNPGLFHMDADLTSLCFKDDSSDTRGVPFLYSVASDGATDLHPRYLRAAGLKLLCICPGHNKRCNDSNYCNSA